MIQVENLRRVEAVIAPGPGHMVGDGFKVHSFIPSNHHLNMQRMSPFLVLDYNPKMEVQPSDTPKGVGVHPHRGFETVTIAYHGSVAHKDSAGGGGIIGEGEVQWMTAASGVLHKEFYESNFAKSGGSFQMVQLWVNLPAKYKMSKPKYQALTKEKITKVMLEDDMGVVEVIAGSYAEKKGPAETFTPVHLYNVKLRKEGIVDFSFPLDFTTALLVIEGSITVNHAQKVNTDHFVLFDDHAEKFNLQATEDAIVLVLSGEPIHEPIASYGPFVMNTKAELMQAYEDFNLGRFGYLEDE